MSSEAPEFSLLLNSIETADYFTRLEARKYITHQVGQFDLVLDDGENGGHWDALKWPQPALFKINTVPIFKGRIDAVTRHYDKTKDGYIATVKGRQNGGALQDTMLSTYYDDTPDNIVTDLLDRYNDRKLSNDPEITAGTISFGTGDFKFQVKWPRNSIWKNLDELCKTVSATIVGTPTFFDFWVDDDNQLNIMESGSEDQSLDIGGIGGEWIKERDWTQDALPVKNDIWVWGDQNSGRLPLEMQPTWGSRQTPIVPMSDPWTEGNAHDFLKSSGIDLIEDSNEFLPGIGIASTKSIHILALVVLANPILYWSMRFPFGTNPVKWPGQPPGGGLNLFNETEMSETMGEINGVGFGIKSDTDIDLFISLLDGQGNPMSARTQSQRFGPGFFGGAFGQGTTWQNAFFPIGPSSNMTVSPISQAGVGQTRFEWENVAELAFAFRVTKIGLGFLNIWFDGLYFTKPLVANSSSETGNSRRTDVRSATQITDYQFLRMFADGIRSISENEQKYYDYTIYGRPDIQEGKTFMAEGKKLLVRELIHTATKAEGYDVKVKAFESVQ